MTGLPTFQVRRSNASMRWLAIVLVLAVAGCGTFPGIHNRGPALDVRRLGQSGATELSPRTLQVLQRCPLDYRRAPADVLAHLQAEAEQDPHADLVLALAELCSLLGEQSEGKNPHETAGYFYLSAGYSYHYLFDDGGSHSGEINLSRTPFQS